MIQIVNDSITTVTNGYIICPCDCVSLTPPENSATEQIVGRFGRVNNPFTLRKRRRNNDRFCSDETRSTPGTVFILGEEKGPDVIYLFNQYFPNDWNLTSFRMCLDALIDYFEFFTEPVEIHVPVELSHREEYEQLFTEFERELSAHGVQLELYLYY